MVKVLADENLYRLEKFIPEGSHLTRFNPDEGLPVDAGSYDGLLVRTVTSIGPDTLPLHQPRLRFVGSGSAGTDHIDTRYLRRNGISFAHAPGCNARAVAEYVVTALFIWSSDRQVNLDKQTIGIVGVGNVGAELADILDELGISYLAYDPPRAQREEAFHSCTKEELLESGILTLHTPLVHSGEYPTYHWLDNTILSSNRFKLIINAARGGIINEEALREARRANIVDDFILDVWENEPEFHDATARKAYITTPHIAGYSEQAKQRATQIICRAMAKKLSLPPPPSISSAAVEALQEIDQQKSYVESRGVTGLLEEIHPLLDYQHDMNQLIGSSNKEKSRRFAAIRTGRSYRYEFPFIELPVSVVSANPVLKKLGFRTKGNG